MIFMLLFLGYFFLFIGIIMVVTALYLGWSAGGAAWVFVLFPMVNIVIGVALVISQRKKKSKVNELKSTGDKILCTVVDVQPDYSMTVNRRPSFRIIVRDDENHTYASDRLTKYRFIPTEFIGATLPVYIDKEDRTKYVVAVDEVEEYN